MDQKLFVKMAMLQTIADTLELLLYLRQESSTAHHQRIDDMVHRLATMANALK